MQLSDNCLVHAYFHKIQEEIHNIDRAIKSSSVIGFFCQRTVASAVNHTFYIRQCLLLLSIDDINNELLIQEFTLIDHRMFPTHT